jgi:hypothetical protein
MPRMKRFRSRKALLIAVLALTLIGGAGAAIAAAQDSPSSRVSSYLEGVAKHLGVSSDELKDAMKAAAIDEVDAALADGRISEDEADALKERIESGEAPPFFLPFLGPRFDHVPGRPHFDGMHFFFEEKLSTAADYLGLTQDELEERLNDGSSLADVAQAEGKSVEGLKQALMDDATERIDQALEDGKLTEDEADSLREGLEERIDAFVDHAFFRFHDDSGGMRIPRAGPFW